MDEMTVQDLTSAAAFPPATDARWRALVEGVLKGGDFERRLVARSRDGLPVGPLYEAASEAPQPLRAGSGPWRVAARVDHPDPTEAAALALADLEGGVGALDLVLAGAPSARGHGLSILELDDLDRALAGVAMPLVALRLDAGSAGRVAAALLVALAERRGHALLDLDLDLGLDPVGVLAATGRLSAPWETVAARAAETLADLDRRGFRGRLLRADGRPFHEAGASEAQELAAVLASGIAHLRALEAGGHTLPRARAAIGLRLVADADLFLTVAKFRAARRLWARIEAACGLDPAPVVLDAETAWRMTTRRDPWVNLLRGTVAVFALGLGGADTITVLPFTAALGLPDAFARRLARNTQAVLQEEANLWRVADPAAGAGGFEALTESLCEAAWTAFQAIEAEGGIVASLASGALQSRIAAVAEARRRDVATRREPITGTSEFPLPRETPVAVLLPMVETAPEPSTASSSAPATSSVIAFAELVATALAGEPAAAPPPGLAFAPALPSERLAAPFERLREAAERRPGGPPRLFLAGLGPIAAHTARSTFAKNAFEAGGVDVVANEAASTPDALAEALRASGARMACLCSSDALYAESGPDAARALSAAGAGPLWLAGRPGEAEEAWREAGVTGFLYAGCDLLAVLEEALA